MLKNSSPCITQTILSTGSSNTVMFSLARLPGRREIRFQIVADVDARVHQLVAGVAGQHDLHVQVGQPAEKVVLGLVEAGPQRA